MNVFTSTTLLIVFLMVSTSTVIASGNHKHSHDNEEKLDDHHHAEPGKEHDHDKMFLKRVNVDGYAVIFHVMPAKPGKEMGGSHDFMIKIEKNKKVITGVIVNSKVVHPNGHSETKKMMKKGEWMMAGYDLGHEGKHQLMILFKTAKGEKHKTGIYYP